MGIPMKKRYVKRLVRKVILFLLAIGFLSIVTTMIVEQRIAKQDATSTAATDFNGDPVTQPFPQLYNVETPRRPRPPVRQRHFEDQFDAAPIPQESSHAAPPAEVAPHAVVDEFALPEPQGPLKDWHDYAAIEEEAKRVGIGEHGKPAFIKDESLRELEHKMYRENGFNALLSDSISINRSIPDVRHAE